MQRGMAIIDLIFQPELWNCDQTSLYGLVVYVTDRLWEVCDLSVWMDCDLYYCGDYCTFKQIMIKVLAKADYSKQRKGESFFFHSHRYDLQICEVSWIYPIWFTSYGPDTNFGQVQITHIWRKQELPFLFETYDHVGIYPNAEFHHHMPNCWGYGVTSKLFWFWYDTPTCWAYWNYPKGFSYGPDNGK